MVPRNSWIGEAVDAEPMKSRRRNGLAVRFLGAPPYQQLADASGSMTLVCLEHVKLDSGSRCFGSPTSAFKVKLLTADVMHGIVIVPDGRIRLLKSLMDAQRYCVVQRSP